MQTPELFTEPDWRLLRDVARAQLAGTLAPCALEALPVDTWRRLPASAEYHGLAPLAYRWLKGTTTPPDTLRALRALTLRNRLAAESRAAALAEIHHQFEARSISYLLLKGAALAHLVYPTPELRPMRDLDLLVGKHDLDHARQALLAVGFDCPVQHSSRFMAKHHHLPNASRTRAGMQISVEIHHDALDRDLPHSLTLDALHEPPQKLTLPGDIPAYALGHLDMLHHLCLHTFVPAERTRLMHLLEIVAYAEHFNDEIDWLTLNQRFPHVNNALRCIHFVLPLPQTLWHQITPPDCPPPTGVGRGLAPLTQIMGSRRALATLLHPPPWWLHAYYAIAPEASLRACYLLQHPRRVTGWLARRAASALVHWQHRGRHV